MTQNHHFHQSHRRRQLGRAAVVGIGSGLLSVIFQISVRKAEETSVVFAHWGLSTHGYGILVVVAVACLLGALSVGGAAAVAPETSGSGVPYTKAMLLGVRSLRPLRTIVVKIIGGVLAFFAGYSIGSEGPTVQLGAAVGVLYGDTAKLPKRDYKPLISAGAGAGLAAAFNAPLTGFIFVMEELRREMSAITYGTALLACVCSVAVTRFLLGSNSLFAVSNPGPLPNWMLPVVALLGVFAGFVGVFYNKFLVGCAVFRDRHHIKPAVAGGLVGVLAGILLLSVPQITGEGHGMAAGVIDGSLKLSIGLAFGLCLAKLLFTAVSAGTGVPGGNLVPILSFGGLLGYGFALSVGHFWPAVLPLAPGLATVGMAALLSSSVRVPLTGCVLVLEVTGEYGLLFSLLVAAFASYATAELLQDRPLYEALLDLELKKTGDEEAESGAEPAVIEMLVEPMSDMDGRKVRELGLPEGTLMVGILRGDREVIPHGNTELHAGDMITVLVQEQVIADALRVEELAKAP